MRTGNSTELLFGTHLSFGKHGKTNLDKAKLDEIGKSVSSTMSQAVLGAADLHAEACLSHPASADIIDLSSKQRNETIDLAKRTLGKLESIHRSALNQSGGGADEFFQFGSVRADKFAADAPSLKWNDIYNQDGILVSECMDDRKSIGTLRATCNIDASPVVIRRLLTEHPEIVDKLVEERKLLAQLNARTSVQWIAYGSVWPVGAFDFLVVTFDEICTNSKGEQGFVIVSTSVDGIIDDDIEAPLGEDGNSREDSSEEDEGGGSSYRSAKSKYSRSCLRMAGYVGQPDNMGGTELSLYLDVDVYAYIPGWLMQLLAQNGLSEMMGRLREAAVLINHGQNPAQAALQSKFGSMLSQIQQREERLRILQCTDDTSEKGDVTQERRKWKPNGMSSQNDGSQTEYEALVSNTTAISTSAVGSEIEDSTIANSATVPTQELTAARLISFPDIALQRLVRYLGESSANEPFLEWNLRMSKNNISIYSAQVPNSTWNALKANIVMNTDIDTLKKLLLDDSRIGEYDDMFDTCEVSILNTFPLPV